MEHVSVVTFDLISVIIYLAIFCVIGSIGNALVIYVTTFVRESIVSRHFIITLAVVDLVTCVLIIPMTSYWEYVQHNVKNDVICKVYHFFITSNVPFSVFTMVAIAFERCFAICRPHWRVLSPKLTTAILATISVLLGTIVSLSYGVDQLASKDYLDKWMQTEIGWSSFEQYNISETSTLHPADLLRPNNSSSLPDALWTDELRLKASKLFNGTWVGENFYVRIGTCGLNDLLISEQVQWYFHKIYASLYLVSLFFIICLYSFIFHTVLSRQKRKSRQRAYISHRITTQFAPSPVGLGENYSPSPSPVAQSEICLVTLQDTTNFESQMEMISHIQKKNRRESAKRDSRRHIKKSRTMSAEVKSATMLFVITMVFVITYIPAFLMSVDLLTYCRPIFYLYFLNFAINPIIYGFMNNRFRKRFKAIGCIKRASHS